VPVIIFRPFNIYGKNQKEDFLIPSILKQASSGTVLLKDSRPKRDYIYIADIVDAYITAIERKSNDFEVYNLGTGQSHSIEIITELVQKYFKRKLNVLFTNEYRENEVLNTVADVSKAEELLQWKPKVLLEEGIRRIILQES
jgi:UDP-glucose 4-epimerase